MRWRSFCVVALIAASCLGFAADTFCGPYDEARVESALKDRAALVKLTKDVRIDAQGAWLYSEGKEAFGKKPSLSAWLLWSAGYTIAEGQAVPFLGNSVDAREADALAKLREAGKQIGAEKDVDGLLTLSRLTAMDPEQTRDCHAVETVYCEVVSADGSKRKEPATYHSFKPTQRYKNAVLLPVRKALALEPKNTRAMWRYGVLDDDPKTGSKLLWQLYRYKPSDYDIADIAQAYSCAQAGKLKEYMDFWKKEFATRSKGLEKSAFYQYFIHRSDILGPWSGR